MTSAEATQLKNSLIALRSSYPATSLAYYYISRWIPDVDGLTNGLPVTEESAGRDAVAYPVCTVATLPATPATGDFAVVTDSNIAAPGTTVTAGGAVRKLVKYSGTLWQVQ